MSFLKKSILFFASFALRSSLFLGFTLLAVVIVVSDRQHIKDTLIEVDAYDRFSQALIDSAKEQSGKDANAIPLDQPELASVVKSSLDSDSLQRIAETFIDSGYDWLNGDKDTLEFSIDVTKNKEALAKGVSDYAVARMILLPPCEGVPAETNVYLVECYPVGLDLDEQRIEIYDMLINDDSIFPADILTSENLPKSSAGQTFADTYSKIPLYYKILQIVPWVMFGVAVLCSITIISLSRVKRKAFNMISKSLLGTGIILIIAPLLYIYIFPALGISLPTAGEGAPESIASISSDITSQIYINLNRMIINIAIQVTTIGIIIFLLSRFIKTNRSAYYGLEKKAGVAVSINKSTRKSGSVTMNSVPIQTSENQVKKQRTPVKSEKKYRKM